VLVAHDLPELGTDLVAALTTLDMHDLTHGVEKEVGNGSKKTLKK